MWKVVCVYTLLARQVHLVFYVILEQKSLETPEINNSYNSKQHTNNKIKKM